MSNETRVCKEIASRLSSIYMKSRLHLHGTCHHPLHHNPPFPVNPLLLPKPQPTNPPITPLKRPHHHPLRRPPTVLPTFPTAHRLQHQPKPSSVKPSQHNSPPHSKKSGKTYVTLLTNRHVPSFPSLPSAKLPARANHVPKSGYLSTRGVSGIARSRTRVMNRSRMSSSSWWRKKSLSWSWSLSSPGRQSTIPPKRASNARRTARAALGLGSVGGGGRSGSGWRAR